jgi:hypothetical protein
VKVNNVVYKNMTGISELEEVINFKCNKSFPYLKVWLEDVNLVCQEHKSVKATCESVKLTNQGNLSFVLVLINKRFAFNICLLMFILNNNDFCFYGKIHCPSKIYMVYMLYKSLYFLN